jgi:hypothetical protein
MAIVSSIARKGKLVLTDYLSLIVFAIAVGLLSENGSLTATSFLIATGFSLLFIGALGAVVSIWYHRPWLTHATIEFVGMWICVAATGNILFAVFAYILTATIIWIATVILCRWTWRQRRNNDVAVCTTLIVIVMFLGGLLGLLFFTDGLTLITGVNYIT